MRAILQKQGDVPECRILPLDVEDVTDLQELRIAREHKQIRKVLGAVSEVNHLVLPLARPKK